eukprot:m.710011 g.710011  ORF g.710011 m.710011 type:complete len:326 (+) comp22949_c0_seq4:1017-1994(+)
MLTIYFTFVVVALQSCAVYHRFDRWLQISLLLRAISCRKNSDLSKNPVHSHFVSKLCQDALDESNNEEAHTGHAQEYQEYWDDATAGGVTNTNAADADSSAADGTSEARDSDTSDTFSPWTFVKSVAGIKDVELPPVALPKKACDDNKLTLVLDLDETLVHCSLAEMEDADHKFYVTVDDVKHLVFARFRPHVAEFLQRVADMYEVVLFTASRKDYANKVLELLDVHKTLIQHRLFRMHCVCLDGTYVKDLRVLGRSLKHTLIVDNSPQAYALQLSNGVPIESWYDDRGDVELLTLLPFLEDLATSKCADVRIPITEKFRLHENL